MQDAPVGNWSGESPLTKELLGSLRDLNHRFLDLAAARRDAGGGPWAELPSGVALLSSAQKRAAASCPYALFDVRFHDDSHWRARLQNGAPGSVADAPAPGGAAAEFTELALFFAWHVASAGTLAAQLILGMNAHTAASLGGLTVTRLPALAAQELPNLRARWSECAAFWRALIDAASHADPKALRHVQLFGLQLAAAARLPRTPG